MGYLKNFCIFVSTNHFRSDSKINIYDKGVSTVHNSERVVLPFLKWLVTPNGTPAYKFFKMTNKKNFVTASTCAKVTQNPTTVLTLNDYIIKYVALRLRFSNFYKEPICKDYMVIYNQSLNSAML